MAYTKGSTTTLKSSASLLPNNLSVLTGLEGDSTTFVVAHKASVNIVHIASGVCNLEEVFFAETKDNKDATSYLTGAKLCQLQSLRVVLVLTSFKGFQILDWKGSKQLYFNKFNTPEGSFTSRFAQGIASVGNFLCIGTSEGNILMLNVPASQDEDIRFNKQLQGHSAPILAIAANAKGKLASCDEKGVIIVWLDPLTCADSSTAISDSSSGPCQSLCFWNSLLIGAFANGQIKIFHCNTGLKMVEIAAHARYINALDIAVQSGLLLSASEDNTVSVWKLPPKGESKVSHLWSTTMSNSILCGGRFIGSNGAKFAVTSFDSTELFTFSQSS